MKEILDVVDENDKVIGKATRKECKEKKLWHRISLIFVFRDDTYTEILLQKRSMNKENSPGKISLPGGHVDSGENYHQAASRELYEEEGIKPELELMFKYKRINKNKFVSIFKGISKDFFTDKEETEESYFINIEQVKEDIEINPKKYSSQFKEVFDIYYQDFVLED